MPEKSIAELNNGIRLLTPDRVARVAFGRSIDTPNLASSSFRRERSQAIWCGICYPVGVMYRGIIGCYKGAAFDPHVKEVGKK